MRDILLIVHFRIKEMPLLLRFFFAFSMLAGLLSVLALAPITTYKINDQKITYQEWWAGGHGVTMIIIGLLFSISGIGIFKKTKWARIAFLFSLSIPVFLTPVRPSIDYILALMVWIAIFGCYLFLKKSVKNYFSTAKSKRG
ncbi:MAG: hypothetical protein ACOYU2_13440 [Nitrospirota bacterium]